MGKYIEATTKVMHGNPDGFGMYYIGSSKERHNRLKSKKLKKQK